MCFLFLFYISSCNLIWDVSQTKCELLAEFQTKCGSLASAVRLKSGWWCRPISHILDWFLKEI